jgi:spore germination protein
MKTDLYVIQSNDTLAEVADKLKIPVSILSFLNGIAPSQQLVSGEAILIPVLPRTIISLAYFQLNRLDDLARTLRQIDTSITYGALFQLPVTMDGVFLIPKDVHIEWFVSLLKAHHILPLLVITNLTPHGFDPELAKAVIGNESLKNQTINNLVRVLSFYDFAGVNIDFENVAAEDRELYNNFIRSTNQALHAKGYILTMTVPPKNSDTDPAKNAYDYETLGKWADYIFIMTYDWGYPSGPPMAIAPLNEVQKVLSYALSKILNFKIIQGIPLYGYDWQLPFSADNPARTVTLIDVYDIARRFGATIQYDSVAESPFFNYRDDTGRERVVWFEDSRSVRAKYAGARNQNLGGIGFWSGQNDPYGFRQNWITFAEMFKIIKGWGFSVVN